MRIRQPLAKYAASHFHAVIPCFGESNNIRDTSLNRLSPPVRSTLDSRGSFEKLQSTAVMNRFFSGTAKKCFDKSAAIKFLGGEIKMCTETSTL
jgi:hypothetical protein